MPVFHASTIAQIPGVSSVVPIVIGGGYTRKEAAILIGVPVSEMLSFVLLTWRRAGEMKEERRRRLEELGL
jgi:hypothetical protein